MFSLCLSLSLSSIPLNTGSIPVGRSLFSPSSGPVFLDDVDCDGTETELLDCDFRNTAGTQSCSEDSHAGVICPCE